MNPIDRRGFLDVCGKAGLGLAAGSAIAPGAHAQQGPQAPPPNIIFILLDDLGWTDLACCGSDLYETPNIDLLARRGVRFTDAYSACTVCSPTRAAVMTGKYPARLHVTDWIHGHKRPNAPLSIPGWTEYLPLEETTIAEALKLAGYATCHIGKWHLGYEDRWPDKQGFDHNIGGYHRGQPPSYFSPYRIPTLEDGPEGEYLTDREAAEACHFIESSRDRPFFLYLAHYGVHTPLQAKPDLVAHYNSRIRPGMRHTNARYAAMIHSVDESLGRITRKLQQLGLEDRTVIFFTSDNGGLVLWEVTDNWPLRAGKGSVYEGGVRVPLVVYWPGVTPQAATCREPVSSVDFFPTMLDVAQCAPTAGTRDLDGKSLAPLLRRPRAALDRDAIFWHYPHYHPGGATPYGAIRQGPYKLVERYENMSVELHDLEQDIGQTRNLSDEQPKRTKQLRNRLHDWRATVRAQMPTPNPDYKPAEG